MILVIAQPAYAPIEGMISVTLGVPAYAREEAKTIKEAAIIVSKIKDNLIREGKSFSLYTRAIGRKPRGYDAAKGSMRYDFIVEGTK